METDARPNHPQKRRRVILESPFRGASVQETNRNFEYALEALRHSISIGEAPFGSHLIYPAVLDDAKPSERTIGITMGYAWWIAAEAIVFYLDQGWSEGMMKARLRALDLSCTIEERYIAKD